MHDCRGRNYTINTRNETIFQHNDQSIVLQITCQAIFCETSQFA